MKNTVEDIELEEEEKTDRSYLLIFVTILFEAAFGLFVYWRCPDVILDYLIAIAPIMVISFISGWYCYMKDIDMTLYRCACFLVTIGIGLQEIVDAKYDVVSEFSIIKYLIAFAIALVIFFIYRLFKPLLNKKYTPFVFFAISSLIYVVLAIYGYDPNGNGTRAWLALPGYTLQLTDFAKISAMVFYASLLSNDLKENENMTLLFSTTFLIINLIGSVYIKELGSFFILLILHWGMLAIFLPSSKKKMIYLISIIVICAGAISLAFILYKYLLPQYEAGTLNTISSFLWPFIKKIYERFSITANINNDPYGAGYQLLQAKKAMWMAGLLGNTVNFTNIIVPESDMAFITLINEFGWLLGFYVVYLFGRIALCAANISSKRLKYDEPEAIIALACGMMLLMQAMIVILGSCNIIPFTGLPIPFLSRGNTYQIIVFVLLIILLHLSKEEMEESE